MNVSGTMNSATGHTSVSTRTGNFNDGLYDRAGARPDLDLDFARTKSLKDRVSKEELITFTRSSGAGYGATYVDENGLVKVATVNLLKYSEQLDQAPWVSGTSITPNNVVAPDGTTTADTWSYDSTRYGFYNNSASSWMSGHNQVLYPFTITDKWVRYSISLTTESGQTSMWIFPLRTNDNNNYVYQTGIIVVPNTDYVFSAWYKKVGTKVYVWGCQLEKGSVATEYIPTTDQVSGAPRFTHDPETKESKGLLIEQQVTNLELNSQLLGSWFHGAGATGSYDNSIQAPDGTYGSVYAKDNQNEIYQTWGTVPSGTTQVTISYFAKAKPGVTNQFVTLEGFRYSNALGNLSIVSQFHLTNKTFATILDNTDSSLTNPSEQYTRVSRRVISNEHFEEYPNGWFRIFATITLEASQGDFLSNSARLDVQGAQHYVWGVQVEAGAVGTSYIPTTTATVTRSPDLTSIEGNNFGTYRTNLKTNSENFSDNALYPRQQTSIQDYAGVSPTGKYDASLVTATGTTDQGHNFRTTNLPNIETGEIYTITVHAKPTASLNTFYMNFQTKANTEGASTVTEGHMKFQLTGDGVLLPSNNLIPSSGSLHSIKKLDNGWYRCRITTQALTQNTNAKVHIKLKQNASFVPASPPEALLVWGFQVEKSSNMTEYIPSTDKYTNRQSNATFVDGNGIIRKTVKNFIAHSHDINDNNSTWSKTEEGGGSVTKDANLYTAPNGLLEATKYTFSIPSGGASGNRNQLNGSTSGLVAGDVVYASVYMKSAVAGQTQKVNIAVTGSSRNVCHVTDEWQRFEISAERTDTSYQFRIGIRNGDANQYTNKPNSGTYDAQTSSVYLWGAQIEKTLIEASDHSNTHGTNSAGDNGLLTGLASELVKTTGTATGAARYSHDPDTLTPTGLYLEPAATNLSKPNRMIGSSINRVTMNSLAEQAAGQNTNGVVSPDGTAVGVARAYFTGTESVPYGGVYFFNRTGAGTTNDPYHQTSFGTGTHTSSIFVKPGLETKWKLSAHSQYASVSAGGPSNNSVNFNFTLTGNGTVDSISTGGIAASIKKYPNGWYRLSATYHTNSDVPRQSWYGVLLYPITHGTYNNFSSDTGLTSGELGYFWGPQVEAGEVLTSYIPTNDAEATRSADTFTSTATEVLDRANGTKPGYFTTEGLTLRCDCKFNNERQLPTVDGTIPSSHSYNRIFDFRDSSSSVFKSFVNNFANYTTPPKPVLAVYGGDMYTAQVYNLDDTFHLVFRYQQNNSNLRITNTDTNSADTTMTVGKPTSILIGRSTVNGQEMNGTINRLTFWKIPFDEAKPNPNSGSTMRKLAK